jgi:hypothetical protein
MYVGVSLTLQVGSPIGGMTSFVIVPAEAARTYTHNGPLPEGAVMELAWNTGPQTVQLGTSRQNKLLSGRRYVVFLSWPAETVPVAVLDLPPVDHDFTATLPAALP